MRRLSSYYLTLEFCTIYIYVTIFLKILFIFREWEGKEEETGRNINVWLPLMCPASGDLACNPDMCPRLGIEPATL